jgi:hypothetical protein
MNSLANRWLNKCVELCIFNKINDTDKRNIPRLEIDGSLVRFPLILFNQIL